MTRCVGPLARSLALVMLIASSACRPAVLPAVLPSGGGSLEHGGAIDTAHYVMDAIDAQRWVTLEDEIGRVVVLPWNWVPEGAREGDMLEAIVTEHETGRSVHLRVDREASAARRERLQERRDRLPRAPAGDLELWTGCRLRPVTHRRHAGRRYGPCPAACSAEQPQALRNRARLGR